MTITPFLWGPERLVNTQTTSLQYEADVAVLANGNYVVTWQDLSGIGGEDGKLDKYFSEAPGEGD